MTYELFFHPKAMKEWNKLDADIKTQFKKILKRRLENPHITSALLKSNLKNFYKVKLRQSGYRLVYHVNDSQLEILVVAVGQRNKNKIYRVAETRTEVA